MKIPAELLYTKSHEWVQMLDATTARVGMTDYAQGEMGDLVFVNLPQEGDAAVAGQALADVESVKAVSDIISPVSGTVSAVNEALLDAPENINTDPYGAFLFEVNGVTEKEPLLDAAAYEAFCAEEG